MRQLSPRRRKPSSARGKAPRRRLRSLAPLLSWRLGLCVLALATLTGAGWLWTTGWVARQAGAAASAAFRMTAEVGLGVDEVLVEGRQRTEPDAILAALAVTQGTPILELGMAEARTRLEALPWVREAAVERRLPGQIYVRLVEREPFALWQLHGKLSVIDRDGVVVPEAQTWRFVALPLVVGKGANVTAAALIELLESAPDMKRLVTAAVRVGDRRWNIRLEDKVDIRLPEADAAAAWTQFAQLERQHGLLGRDVIAIDLRVPDRLVVRTAPGTEIQRRDPDAGRDT